MDPRGILFALIMMMGGLTMVMCRSFMFSNRKMMYCASGMWTG